MRALSAPGKRDANEIKQLVLPLLHGDDGDGGGDNKLHCETLERECNAITDTGIGSTTDTSTPASVD